MFFYHRNSTSRGGIAFLLVVTLIAGGANGAAIGHRDDGPGSDDRRPAPETVATAPNAAADSGHARTDRADQAVDTGLIHEGLDWGYCGPRPVGLGPVALPQPSAEDRLVLSADTFDYDQELDLLWLSGDVQGSQGSRFVAADKVVYDRNTSDLVAMGNIFLTDSQLRLIADEARLNLTSDRGDLTDIHYRLTGKVNARGNAERAGLVRPTLTRYRNVAYSTCRPGQNTWSLDATELALDRAEGWGVARNAKLRVHGLPIFYTPYLSFPLDDRRKSGLLAPTIGNSDDKGIDITLPYYWNIAPNMDATLSLRSMSRRGPMLETEFRHLSPRQELEFSGDILPEDRQLENRDRRWALRIRQGGSFNRRWSTALHYNAVSDNQYFEDFGNQLEQTSTRNIERRGDLNYAGDGWHAGGRLQKFQTLDATLAPASRPYARLPQLIFATNPHQGFGPGIELGLSGEYNYFHHDTLVHGHRASLRPFARWPLRKSYGYLIPQMDLHLAGYDLQDQRADKNAHPSHAIPSFNLDTKLVFERRVRWFGEESLQTLEPRLFYLYTPFRDQEDIPVFDSAELGFSYNSLFRPNRFSGQDRIGDANQLTIGLTSRTLDGGSGRESLRASIGHILYFRDRDIQLSGPPEEERISPIAGLLSARFRENWTGHASFEYDSNRSSGRLSKRTLELNYRTSDNGLFNLAYRFDLDTYENTDLSFSLPVSRQLQFVGRWNYSLLNHQTVEAFAGIEYGRCCWRVRLMGHHLKNEPDSAGTNSFMLQFELAGLGSLGQRVDRFFERSVRGYSMP
ncbi:MAG: LPS-assembly protein LptD [Candidatus Thiosymbion ectosymbiont of Robbea hypermnestra]|nr:LPS-assembly protein LptD [Candidatus Thiosymbion ectosymbiont of Robbea hypermnestra]